MVMEEAKGLAMRNWGPCINYYQYITKNNMKKGLIIFAIFTTVFYTSCKKDNNQLDSLNGSTWIKDEGGKDNTYIKLSFVKDNNANSDCGLGYWKDGEQRIGYEGDYYYDAPNFSLKGSSYLAVNSSGKVDDNKMILNLKYKYWENSKEVENSEIHVLTKVQ